MHPAFSILFFTTLAGAAQGLVFTLALAALFGLALAPGFLTLALGVAEALLVAGLAASFMHLGRKTRAWRAVLMWRTSWMSREVIVLPAFIALVGLWWLSLMLGIGAPWSWLLPCWCCAGPSRLVLHRDDLCLSALHRGMGASADYRQLHADRVVVGAGAGLCNGDAWLARCASCKSSGRVRWLPRWQRGLRAGERFGATRASATSRRCSPPPASARRSWFRSRWACRPGRSTRASSFAAHRWLR